MEDVLKDAEAADLREDAEEFAEVEVVGENEAMEPESNDPEMQLDGTAPDAAPQVSMRRVISTQSLMITPRFILPLPRALSPPQEDQFLQMPQGRRFPQVPCPCLSRLSLTVRAIIHTYEHY